MVYNELDSAGFNAYYKVMCIDIDGVKNKHGYGDCRDGLCPFGYGLRVDGKILIGKKATQWLEKTKKKNMVQ